jgi:hypothetical protein
MSQEEGRIPEVGDELWLVLSNGQIRRCIVDLVGKEGVWQTTKIRLIPFKSDGTRQNRRSLRVSDDDLARGKLGWNLFWEFYQAQERAMGRAAWKVSDCRKKLHRANRIRNEVTACVQAWVTAGTTD